MGGEEFHEIAALFADLIRPQCERVEIAGSIRRGKTDPKDIEIVAVPLMSVETRQRTGAVGMFEAPTETVEVDALASRLDALVAGGQCVRGRAWGPRYKRIEYDGAPIDLFCVLPPAQWGVIFAIRTGPAEFGKALVTSRLAGGFMPVDKHVASGQLWHGGALVSTPEEEDYFREIGVPCWPPVERSVERLEKWKRGKVSA